MAFETYTPKRAHMKASAEIRIGRSSSGAVRIAFPKHGDIQAGSRMDVAIGYGDDRGWLALTPTDSTGYSVSMSGGTPSLTFTPPIKLKSVISVVECHSVPLPTGGVKVKVPADLHSTIWPDPALVAA